MSKVSKYEEFLNERLKPDLNSVLQQRDKIYEEIAEYLALKNTISAVQKSELKPGQPLKARVDLGANFYAQAEVEDPSKIFVEAGLGFFVELTLEEAVKLAEKRSKLLEKKADLLTEEANKIKANIKLVLEGLREMQNLNQNIQ